MSEWVIAIAIVASYVVAAIGVVAVARSDVVVRDREPRRRPRREQRMQSKALPRVDLGPAPGAGLPYVAVDVCFASATTTCLCDRCKKSRSAQCSHDDRVHAVGHPFVELCAHCGAWIDQVDD